MAERSFCHFFLYHFEDTMSMFNKKFENVNYLDLIPVKLQEHVMEENGLVSVLFPRFTNKILVSTVGRMLKNPNVKAKLDKLGTALWLEIDNNKNVDTIINNLKKKLGDEIEPAHERITSFLTKLYKYKFITLKEIK